MTGTELTINFLTSELKMSMIFTGVCKDDQLIFIYNIFSNLTRYSLRCYLNLALCCRNISTLNLLKVFVADYFYVHTIQVLILEKRMYIMNDRRFLFCILWLCLFDFIYYHGHHQIFVY